MQKTLAVLFAVLTIALMAVAGCGGNLQSAPNARYVSQKCAPGVAFINMSLDESVRGMLLSASLDVTLSEEERKAALTGTLGSVGGSGFAVREVGDETWFITNRHVATALDTATLSLDRENSMLKARVVYVSDRDDLAVLAIKAKGVTRLDLGGLTHEGQHVLALGYPSVRNLGQIYKATEGIISNACFLEDKDNGSCLIQHTAEFDSGNSGGPLVDARSGRVVGVNTWTFFHSKSLAHVSVPVDHVVKVLERAAVVNEKGQDKAWRQQQLAATVREFLDEKLSDKPSSWHLSYMVSDKLLVRTGLDNYRFLRDSDKAEKVGKHGLMAVMAYATQKRLSADLAKACGTETPNVRLNATDVRFGTHDRARVTVRCGEAQIETWWTYEYGRWQIVDYLSKSMEKENQALTEARGADQAVADIMKELATNERICVQGDANGCTAANVGRGILIQEKLLRQFSVLADRCNKEHDSAVCVKAYELKTQIMANASAYATEAAAQAEAGAKAIAAEKAKAKAKQEAADEEAKALEEARAEVKQARLKAKARAKAAAEAACEDKAKTEGKTDVDCSKAEPPPEPAPPAECNSSPCPGETV